MPIINCPHCGASRNMSTGRLPSKATNARCPQCYQSFSFDPTELPTPVPAETSKVDSVSCPHCGLLRQIPQNRATTPKATLNCRRCQRSFRITDKCHSVDATAPPAEQQQLSGIGPLLTESWELLCQRGWSLLTIYLLAALLIFGPLLLASLTLPQLVMGNQLLAWACLLAGCSYGFWGTAWLTAALFQQVSNPQLRIVQALSLGWKNLGRFAWLLLLLGTIISGGSLLLIIPGILFSIWFLFSHYILAEEGSGGLAALEKSHQLVRGHWWPVFSRMFLLLLVSVAISTMAGRLPVIGATVNFVLTLLLIPFSLLYGHLIYRDLKRCQQTVSTATKGSGRWLYLSLATLGWLAIPAVFMLANNPMLQNRLPLADDTVSLFSKYSIAPTASLQQLTEEQDAPPPPAQPQQLSATDYLLLLEQQQLNEPQPQGISLGLATLQNSHFWNNPAAPQLLLTLKLADLPNLDLTSRRSARILIDWVDSSSGQNLYNSKHSFETAAFQWVDILSGRKTNGRYSGTRSIYLNQGVEFDQIRSIRGKLELTLPIGIESVKLTRNDIGKTVQVAGKNLTLTKFTGDQLTLSLQGERSDLLSVQAANPDKSLLRAAGESWRQDGDQIDLQLMFSGAVDSVTILLSKESMVQSYPFELAL